MIEGLIATFAAQLLCHLCSPYLPDRDPSLQAASAVMIDCLIATPPATLSASSYLFDRDPFLQAASAPTIRLHDSNFPCAPCVSPCQARATDLEIVSSGLCAEFGMPEAAGNIMSRNSSYGGPLLDSE